MLAKDFVNICELSTKASQYLSETFGYKSLAPQDEVQADPKTVADLCI